MSFALNLYFESGGTEGPKLTHTEFQFIGGQESELRTALEQRQLDDGKRSYPRFYWNARSHAIRGFALLCIQHFLSVRNGLCDFILDKKTQFAPALGDAIRSSDPERKSKWLLSIVGVPELLKPKGLTDIFDISSDYSQVKFLSSQCEGAEFRFFLGKEEITGKSEVLAALVRAIQGDGKDFFPLEHPKITSRSVPLSLCICSPGDGFLCVCTPETAKLLRERGLLPLPHNAVAQLHVHFERPQHFCLFSFGPDAKVNSHVPQPNLPTGQARERLTLPGDVDPNVGELAFVGVGGAESFLLLVSCNPLMQADADAAKERLEGILRRVGLIRLSDSTAAFVKHGHLPATRALPPRGRPLSDPLDRLLAEIRCEFTGRFEEFHFISVHRLDPPSTSPGRR
jgi:hypothetical protein